MKITLVDYTGKGMMQPAAYATAMLIFAKSTRLSMSAGLLDDIFARVKRDNEWAIRELDYIANTIPSSWEFVRLSFMIEGVSRGFTHQFVRSRQLSFAQQTMRVLDVSEGDGWEFYTGPTVQDQLGPSGQPASGIWKMAMQTIAWTYRELIASGVKVEDARGVLPTNIKTNILMSGNLRSFVELVRKRSSSRTQGEYREALDGMVEQVSEIYPWIRYFLARGVDKALAELEVMIKESVSNDKARIDMIKRLDIIRDA